MLCPSLRGKIVSADEAALLITHGANIGTSGFTGAGYPKAVPLALAGRMKREHQAGRKLRIGVWSGASTGPELDGALAAAGGISMRLPYQADPECRSAINNGLSEYADIHLSGVASYARSGCLGKLDFALIEAAKILEDGKIVPGTSVGNIQTWLDLADRVILEVNAWHSEKLEGIHDISRHCSLPFNCAPIPIMRPCDRIGTPYLSCPIEKIAAVVETNYPDRNSPFTPADETSKRIAEHIIDFLKSEVRRGCLPQKLLPLQTGVGNISNAVLSSFSGAGFSDLTAFTEVIQDSMIDLLRNGTMACASATAFSLSPSYAAALDGILDDIRGRVVLRPQEISNHPEIIRRLGCIAINTMIEADIYGNVNSTCVMGSRIQNGIGGSGDFARNAYLSFFVSPSRAKNGAVSCIVPMTPHVDHSDHDVRIIVTEQGLADLRGLSPKQRARRIIDTCAHPDFRPALNDYFERARRHAVGQHVPHLLDEALGWHRRYAATGTMLP